MHEPNDRLNAGPWAIARMAIRRYFRHGMPLHAAALVFHVLLSVFPFILLLMALASFLDLGQMYAWNRTAATSIFPPRLASLLAQASHELRPLHGGILSFGAAAALWLASRATRAAMQAMNAAYEVAPPRAAWKRYLLSLAYTVGLVALLTAAAMLMAAGPTVLQWLARLLGFEDGFVRLWTWLRWPAALALLTFVVAIVYYAAPNVSHGFRFVTAGSVLCVAVWGLASFFLRLYVVHLAPYYQAYGSVGAVILLLLYLYLSMVSLLFGAEVNALLEARRRGRDRPAAEPALAGALGRPAASLQVAGAGAALHKDVATRLRLNRDRRQSRFAPDRCKPSPAGEGRAYPDC